MTKKDRILYHKTERFNNWVETMCDCGHSRGYHKSSAVKKEDGKGWDSDQIKYDDEIGDGLCTKCRILGCKRFSTFEDDVNLIREEVKNGK